MTNNALQNKESSSDEFYILATYGTYHAHLLAATTLLDSVSADLSNLYLAHSGPLDKRSALTAAQRGVIAEGVAATKIVTTDTGLNVTGGVFEVTGSRSTAAKVGLDRFWRDLRTHTLHDPVAYKRREVGRWRLLGEAPEPTWYT